MTTDRKKYIILIVILLFTALCYNVFGQKSNYPFTAVRSGQGQQSIIFLPGFACSGNVWNETKSLFENQYTCYTLTMAGFAGVAPESNPSFEAWEYEIARFITDNKIEKPVLVGHSMGGGLALALAADYPELIGKIVVVDALPCLSALMNPAFKTKENNDCSGIMNQIAAMTDEQFLQMQKRSMTQLVENKAMQDTVVSWSMASDRNTFGKMYCDFSNTDLRLKIKSITCPALILLESGFKDMKSAIDEQYKNLNGAQLEYAGKGLHFIMYDDTEWYNIQLSKFITLKQ